MSNEISTEKFRKINNDLLEDGFISNGDCDCGKKGCIKKSLGLTLKGIEEVEKLKGNNPHLFILVVLYAVLQGNIMDLNNLKGGKT